MAAADEVVLLLVHQEQRLLPILRRGLRVTQSTRGRLRRYVGADVVTAACQVFPVLDVRVGTALKPILPWPFDWLSLTGTRNVEVVLGKEKGLSLEDLKRIIKTYAVGNDDVWTQHYDSMSDLAGAIDRARDCREIFRALSIKPNQALDVLV